MYRVVSIIALLVVCKAMRDQSIAVKGRFLCGSKPAAKVRVKLIDVDTGPDPDDLLSQGYTDARGDFMLSGGTAEATQIDPVLKVYHNCNDVTKLVGVPKLGSRKVTFVLPSKYITNGKTPKKIMDIGVINLELKFEAEGRKLIVS
ncbi:hypothetical protein Y032_0490g2386 [Ancylostoma ceylanicum]|nr:hypothetical protein Y032_0490g2386 [Ancylostoma ceylanicum]